MNTVMENIRKALGVAGREGEAARAGRVFAKSAGWDEPVAPVEAGEIPGLVAQIRQEAAHLNLQVHECSSLETCGEELAVLAAGRSPEWGTRRSIMCWDDPLLRGLGLEDRLAAEIALRYVPVRESFNEAERAELREQVVESYMGVTTADHLIADTATLVVLGGKGRGRSVSLVPSIHVAVVPLGRMVRSFREVMRLFDARREALPSNMTFITGPSKTADIEATLVLGAHGPREMHLFLVP
jgi:L-lactate dehydrogenase complex protein LldG